MILYYNGPAANRGCEAVVRSAWKILDISLTKTIFYPEWDPGCGLKILKNVNLDMVPDLLIQRR